MIQYANIAPDGSSVQDQSAEQWARTLKDITGAGFTELDPTDCWIRVADLSPARLAEFQNVVRQAGLTVPAISTARKNLAHPTTGPEIMPYCHRLIDVAASFGARTVCLGLFGALTEAQKQALWFWTVDGEKTSEAPADRAATIARLRELGSHAAEVGVDIALEMYEDTYIGTARGAAQFIQDVDHPSVGLNPDLGNLIRLHRPVEHWKDMVDLTMPFTRYWHVKNYARIEDAKTGFIASTPVPLEMGLINYRYAIGLAIAQGFRGALCCEHYGGDGLSVSATNREYLRRILPEHDV